MNDRAINLLSEYYEFEVLRSWKGRGSILFETPEGIRILKEYNGFPDKLKIENELLYLIHKKCDIQAEEILPSREGELWVQDQGQQKYIVKTWPGGKECNIRDEEECKKVINALARLHKCMVMHSGEDYDPAGLLEQEFERHNRELKRVRRFLKNRSQKNDFELYLLKYYDGFMEKAFAVTRRWKQYMEKTDSAKSLDTWYHGDYQHHNILLQDGGVCVVNFEKCGCGSQSRDFYLFLRKLMEKNDWAPRLGKMLLAEYQKERPMESYEMTELYYRLAYPEKFWKIVNFYYNAGKSWIPGKNIEKLEKLLCQESERELFLNMLL